MRRDHLIEMKVVTGTFAEISGDRAQIGFRSLAVHARYLQLRSTLQGKPRLRPVDREPEAAEGPLPPAARVEKAEMQPCAGRDRNAVAWRRDLIGAMACRIAGLVHCWSEASGIC